MGELKSTNEELIGEIIRLKKRNKELERKLSINQFKLKFIRKSENLYKTLFENTEDGFEIIELIYDSFGEIYDYKWVEVNKSWEKHLGLKSDVVGKKATEIFNNVEGYWLEKYDKVIKTGNSIRYEIYGNETRRWIEAFSFPYEKGKLCTLFRDITEKKQTEQELQERLKQSEKSVQELAEKLRISLTKEETKEKKDYSRKENLTEIVSKSSKTLNILVIDDNKDLAEIMCGLINILGHKSDFALNGEDGILKARQFKPEVILCGIGLPVMNGYEVAKEIRKDNDLKDIYLIALSGYVQPKDVQLSLKAGFNKHLAKPVSLETLKLTLCDVKLES